MAKDLFGVEDLSEVVDLCISARLAKLGTSFAWTIKKTVNFLRQRNHI
jgi:hypothetical protein